MSTDSDALYFNTMAALRKPANKHTVNTILNAAMALPIWADLTPGQKKQLTDLRDQAVQAKGKK